MDPWVEHSVDLGKKDSSVDGERSQDVGNGNTNSDRWHRLLRVGAGPSFAHGYFFTFW